MNQEILEGVPTGRDPWSLAKLIPGVQVATYDVGGTQSIQQSSLSSHGSNTNDVSYNIDGATVNWPGGGGGATMLYYDQGMFEEVNYMTSAIPAEVMVGGVSINMVTKDGGNKWRGNMRYSFANDDLQSETTLGDDLQILPSGARTNVPRQPDAEDLRRQPRRAAARWSQNQLWVNGTIRRWVVNKLTNAKNDDGTQALDDNTLKNYSGKGGARRRRTRSSRCRTSGTTRFAAIVATRRRTTSPDIAALVQTNPAPTTQAKYTGIRNRTGVRVELQRRWTARPTTAISRARRPTRSASRTATLSTPPNIAASRNEEQPNSRHQFDNIVSYSKSAYGDHLLQGRRAVRPAVRTSRATTVQGDYHLIYNNGVPTSVRDLQHAGEPEEHRHMLGFFFQDAWSVASRLTLNLGVRYDRNNGILPEQSNPGGHVHRGAQHSRNDVVNQGSWRLARRRVVRPDRQRPDRAQGQLQPLRPAGRHRPRHERQPAVELVAGLRLDRPEPRRQFQPSELGTGCRGFAGISTFYPDADGPGWPYSDEVTAGVEHQVMRDMRVGAMYYYRTNRDQLGVRNLAVPTSAYTPFTVHGAERAGRAAGGPKPTTVTVYNLHPAFNGLQNNILDNDPYLDTKYNGIEFTANKRFSKNWQMVAGLTIGKNTGGLTVAPT